jgi:sec-independent protein translocase protein TatA
VTGALSPLHWLIIIGVLVLLFGAKKLPDLARSVGQSARIVRAETAALSHDHDGEPAGTRSENREDERTPPDLSAAPRDGSPSAWGRAG